MLRQKNRNYDELLRDASELPKVKLSYELSLDAEKITIGAYSPLEGFLAYDDFRAVLDDMTLQDGTVWSMPIILPIDADEIKSKGLKEGDTMALLNWKDELFAEMEVEDIYTYSKSELASKVFGTTDPSHPNVGRLLDYGEVLVGGPVTALNIRPFDQEPFGKELTPMESRTIFESRGWRTIVGFQCRNPPHIGHEYAQRIALELFDGLFIHPVVGLLKEDDYPPAIIMEAYRSFVKSYYPMDRVVLSPLRIAMRYAGPRATIFLAIIRKNYGCTHFVVGRDIAGVGHYYDPYGSHELLSELDLGIEFLFFREIFYCKKCGIPATERTCPHGWENRIEVSQSSIREALRKGNPVMPEVIRPEVLSILERASEVNRT